MAYYIETHSVSLTGNNNNLDYTVLSDKIYIHI